MLVSFLSLILVVYIAIGILGGVVVIVVIIIFIMLALLQFYRNKKRRNTPNNNMEDGIPLKNGDHAVSNGHRPGKYITRILCITP